VRAAACGRESAADQTHGVKIPLSVSKRILETGPQFRERAKRLGALWRPAQKIWELTWADARRLGIADRVDSG